MYDSPANLPKSKATKSVLPLSLSWKRQSPREACSEVSSVADGSKKSPAKQASSSCGSTTSNSLSCSITSDNPRNGHSRASNSPHLKLTDEERRENIEICKLQRDRKRDKKREEEHPSSNLPATSNVVADSLSDWLVTNTTSSPPMTKKRKRSKEHGNASQPMPGSVKIGLDESNNNIEIQQSKEVVDLSSTVDVTENQTSLGNWLVEDVLKVDETSPPKKKKDKRSKRYDCASGDVGTINNIGTQQKEDIEVVDLSKTVDVTENQTDLGSWLVANVLKVDESSPPKAKKKKRSQRNDCAMEAVDTINNIASQQKEDVEVVDLCSTVDVMDNQPSLGSWLIQNVLKVDESSSPKAKKKKRSQRNDCAREAVDLINNIGSQQKEDVEVVDLCSTVDVMDNQASLGSWLPQNVLKVDESSSPKAKKKKRSKAEKKNWSKQYDCASGDDDTINNIGTQLKEDVEVLDLSKTVGDTENKFGLGSNSNKDDSIIVIDNEEPFALQHSTISKISPELSTLNDNIVHRGVISPTGGKVLRGESSKEKPSLLFTIQPPPVRLSKKAKKKKMLAQSQKNFASGDQTGEEIVFLGTGTSKRAPVVPTYTENKPNFPQTTNFPVPLNGFGTGQSHLPGLVVDKGGNNYQPPVNSQPNIYGNNFDNPMGRAPQTGLRPICIDGSNVAMGHSNDGAFSSRGLEICCQYFVKKGHKVYCFVPMYRKSDIMTRDRHILDELEKQGHLIFTPSRFLQGRTMVPYDDRYVVQTAAELGGIIVSRDNFRDLMAENPNFKEVIYKRLLMFTWIGDIIMFPQDPMGRTGPGLDTFLRF